jgi:hypothetical protein
MSIKCLFRHDWEYSINEVYRLAFGGINSTCNKCKDEYGKMRTCKRCGRTHIKYHFTAGCSWIQLIRK